MVVAIAKENAYSQLYEELKGKAGRKKIYKLANARKRMATDIGRVTTMKDKDGTLLTGDDEVKDRWLGYFDDRLNIENEREDLIRDMYAGCMTSVMTSAGKTKGIEIEVGLHQGSALSPIAVVRDHHRCDHGRD